LATSPTTASSCAYTPGNRYTHIINTTTRPHGEPYSTVGANVFGTISTKAWLRLVYMLPHCIELIGTGRERAEMIWHKGAQVAAPATTYEETTPSHTNSQILCRPCPHSGASTFGSDPRNRLLFGS
jgi:hypothetical protein